MCLSVDVFVCIRLDCFVYIHIHVLGIYAFMCAVQTTFPTIVPAGVCCCCISVCTNHRDFHSQRPADGVCMCQPLLKITNPPQQKQNVPLSFCNFQWQRSSRANFDSRKTPGRILKTVMTDLWNHHPWRYSRWCKDMVVVSYKENLLLFIVSGRKKEKKIKDAYRRIFLLFWNNWILNYL